MKRILIGAAVLALSVIPCVAQSLDDLNIQIHGYATQGFLYTTNNNILTTSSSDGSPAWTEAVVNVSAQPIPKLRIAVQGRYFLLGNYGNSIILDWASADYKASDRFGVRFGKVKTPSGLFNEIQDIDPSYTWALLPQGVYPISSRNSLLSHYGAVAYGSIKLGKSLGKVEYRGWGGERVLGSDDGYWLSQTESGIALPNGMSGATYGAALHWKTPLPGFMLGASDSKDVQWHAPLLVDNGSYALSGTETIQPLNTPNYFAQYEHAKLMVAGEFSRLDGNGSLTIGGQPSPLRFDNRAMYGMATYKLTTKLTGGTYYSQSFNHAVALGPARFQKDWAISGRYDFNEFLYAKAEQHFIDGTSIGYDADMNPNGLKPTSKLTVLKMGVSF
jgi:hypothetical protein